MKIAKLLDEVKAKTGAKSDGELARNLGVSKQAMSSYYSGHRAPDEFVCLKIAQALEKPLVSIIATVKAASEKDETRRAVWENYMKRLGGIAASVLVTVCITVTMLVTSTPAKASTALGFEAGTFCIMLSAILASQLKPILRRIGQKCPFRVNIARFAQMAT